MPSAKNFFYEPWPALPYEEFKSTLHLLHMGTQAIGKLKLTAPFEPHWANVVLLLTSRGLTTGPITYRFGTFSIDMDFVDHQVICATSWGQIGKFKLASMSVAEFTRVLFKTLRDMNVEVAVNPMPMEIADPVAFDRDIALQSYNALLANAWWHILLSTQRVLQRYHARFKGITPPVGFMWGTFDLRDARYKGTPVSTTGPNADYIRRNAMDEAQVEAGWWCGSPAYPRPAFYSFTYPQPVGVEQAKIKPSAAHWDATMAEFILDYDDLRRSKDPDKDLLSFFESTYQAGTERAGWDPKLIGTGEPA